MAAGGHFGWLKITFDRISRHFRSIRNFFFNFFFKMAASGHLGSRIWAILDDRKSLSSAFLAISDQYKTFFWIFFSKWLPAAIWKSENHFWSHFSPFQINTQLFCSQNGCQLPFWMTENYFWSHFSPFQINTQLFFFQNGCRRPFWITENHFRLHFSPFQINTQLFFHKMAASGHFGWPKITFDRISLHFRSIRNFDFFFTKWLPAAILDDWKSPSNAFLAISDQYATFFVEFFFKMAAGGHLGSRIWAILDDRKSLSSAFLAISDQYKTFFWIFFSKWLPEAIWKSENHFWSHFSPFQINTQLFCSQNGCQRPFWMTENHFWSHFSPFQINTQLLFFSQNGCRRPFWITENHFRLHFSPFQINTQLLFHKMAASGHFEWPKITFDRISLHFRSIRNFDFFFTKWLPAAILDDWKSLSNAFLAISDQYATFFVEFFFQNGCRRPFWKSDLGHFGWPKITFECISRHFRSIRNFLFFGLPKITFDRISRHFRSILNFFHILAASGHFGWPKITFECISRHFRSIHKFFFDFFFKMAASGHFGSQIWAILDDRKSLSIVFLAISDQYTTFIFMIFPQNGCRRPFWITENHFRSHFSPFQINTQKKNHFRMHFSPFQINTQLFCWFFFQNGCWRPFWKSDLGNFEWPKITFECISLHFRSIRNFFFFKMVAGGHFGSPI